MITMSDRVVVACTALSGDLVVGRLNKTGERFLEKRPAEPEIMRAMVEHMMHGTPNGSSKTLSLDGGRQWFRITVEPLFGQDADAAAFEAAGT